MDFPPRPPFSSWIFQSRLIPRGYAQWQERIRGQPLVPGTRWRLPMENNHFLNGISFFLTGPKWHSKLRDIPSPIWPIFQFLLLHIPIFVGEIPMNRHQLPSLRCHRFQAPRAFFFRSSMPVSSLGRASPAVMWPGDPVVESWGFTKTTILMGENDGKIQVFDWYNIMIEKYDGYQN